MKPIYGCSLHPHACPEKPHPFPISQFSCIHLRQSSFRSSPSPHPSRGNVHMKPPPSSSTTSTQHRSLSTQHRCFHLGVVTTPRPDFFNELAMHPKYRRSSHAYVPAADPVCQSRRSPHPVPSFHARPPASHPHPPHWCSHTPGLHTAFPHCCTSGAGFHFP